MTGWGLRALPSHPFWQKGLERLCPIGSALKRTPMQDFNSFSIIFYCIIITTYQKIGGLFCLFHISRFSHSMMDKTDRNSGEAVYHPSKVVCTWECFTVIYIHFKEVYWANWYLLWLYLYDRVYHMFTFGRDSNAIYEQLCILIFLFRLSRKKNIHRLQIKFPEI